MPGPEARHRQHFLRRLTLATGWGNGLDGYDLGIISVVLPLLAKDLNISSVWAGLIGASSLIGIFIGGPLIGRLTDRFGRRRLFTLDIVAFIALGVAQGFVGNAEMLFAVRVLLGIAIGAEYAIGAPMLSEFVSARDRGRRGALLEVSWYVGFLASVIVGYTLVDAFGVDWRVVLATSAVPAAVTLVLRHGLPESPRWLLSRGRTADARAIVLANVGDEEHFEAEFAGEPVRAGSWTELLSSAYRGRTALVCGFWACLVAPYFAIFTFAPQVLGALGLQDERSGTITTNGIAALGAIAGVFLIDRIGRRRMLIGPFWICGIALAVVGLWAQAPVGVVVACFVAFAFFNSLSADLCAVYPNEVFPTHLRTTGVGIASAASRIGAAIGTFLLPIGLDTIGVGASMLIGAAICAVGALISQRWAPETSGRTLTETGRGVRVLVRDDVLGAAAASA